jgi:hypothetical protein
VEKRRGDNMSVEIEIFLFGKPAWELDEFENKNLSKDFSKKLRELGKYLYERLNQIADIHEKLVENGWTAVGGLYDIFYYKDITVEEAKKELEELKLEELIPHLEEVDEEE